MRRSGSRPLRQATLHRVTPAAGKAHHIGRGSDVGLGMGAELPQAVKNTPAASPPATVPRLGPVSRVVKTLLLRHTTLQSDTCAGGVP
jgi:hypothetical protein